MTRKLTAVLLGLLVLAAACGGDDGGSAEGPGDDGGSEALSEDEYLEEVSDLCTDWQSATTEVTEDEDRDDLEIFQEKLALQESLVDDLDDLEVAEGVDDALDAVGEVLDEREEVIGEVIAELEAASVDHTDGLGIRADPSQIDAVEEADAEAVEAFEELGADCG